MSRTTPITVAFGDGIGPEIMQATLRILDAAGAKLDIDTIEIGKSVYERGSAVGIEPRSWDSLRRTRVFLKAPITTPQGGGFASLNVTVRKTLGQYANVRPCVSYAPFVPTKYPNMDVVIVRENEEDLYAGIEHRQTDQVVQCLKLISRPGCERIIRYAFEYARANQRHNVTCFTKDNIMKLTDGLFHRVFNEIAADYPEIENEHWIVDIGAAKLAAHPEAFDVMVMPNLYGDILSDVAAQIAGSVGLAGSANIGEHCAMFEAIHGSAPRLAGKGIANPSGLLLGAVMMLVHIGQSAVAGKVHNAWLRTIEDGVHTHDIYSAGVSTREASSAEFAQAVIERLGTQPEKLQAVHYAANPQKVSTGLQTKPGAAAKKELVGVDVFLHWNGSNVEELAAKLQSLSNQGLQLGMITNRGVKVWPGGVPETFCTDHWRCRYTATDAEASISHHQIVNLLQRLAQVGLDFIKTENLCNFDGNPGFSRGQGE